MLKAPGYAVVLLGAWACLPHAVRAESVASGQEALAWAGSLRRAAGTSASYSWSCPDALCHPPSGAEFADQPAAAPESPAAPVVHTDAVAMVSVAAVPTAPAPPVATVVAPLSGTTVVRASFYDTGRVTANGERFLPMGMTAASRKLPFGTRLRVTNPRTGLSVVVRVNDRGPYVRGRALDLSRGAAQAIGLDKAGVAPVAIAVVQ